MERPPPLHMSEGVDGTILCTEVVEGLQRRKLDVSLSSSPAPSLYNWDLCRVEPLVLVFFIRRIVVAHQAT